MSLTPATASSASTVKDHLHELKGSPEGEHLPALSRTRTLGDRVDEDLRLVHESDTDDTTVFYNKHKGEARPLTTEMEKALTRKNFWWLLCQTWWIAFLIHLDKSTLSSASTMGIFKDVAMTKDEYNQLFIVFYAGYLVALWPGAWLSQRIGHKHFITGSLFLWAVLLGVHPAVKTGRQLMALRFLLGLVSGDLIRG